MVARVDRQRSCAHFRDWLLGIACLGALAGLAGCGGGSSSNPVNPTPMVTVSGAGQVRLGSTAQLSATVTNEANNAVTWQVNGVTGGSAATGTISTTGLYTPPAGDTDDQPGNDYRGQRGIANADRHRE